MKIEVSLTPEDIEIYDDYGSESAAKVIFNAAVDQMIKDLSGDYSFNKELQNTIKELVNKNKDIILEKVVAKVSKEILHKKEIVELMPKAKDYAEQNSENKEYFMELVEEAIKRKFK